MSELNERGYGITTRHLGNGMYKYILVSEPLVPSKNSLVRKICLWKQLKKEVVLLQMN